MVDTFSDIPVRVNGPPEIDAGWFNTIRTLLVQILGDASGEATQSIGNTDTNQDVTSTALISDADFSRVDIEYSIRRISSTVEYFQTGNIAVLRKTTGWAIHGDEQNIFGDDALASFSVYNSTSGAYNLFTLRYSTTDIGGSGHVGSITTRMKKWVI